MDPAAIASSSPGLSLSQAIERARVARQAGDSAVAEFLLRQVLDTAPRHVGAWSELASLLQETGDANAAALARREAGAAAIEEAATMAASLLDTPMQGRAVAVLARAVASHPEQASGQLALAELHRRLGDLASAQEACRRCLELAPDDRRALWLQAALDGRRLPADPSFMSPAPVWVIDGYLSADEHAALLEFALTHDQALEPSTVGGIIPRSNWRRSQVDSNLHKSGVAVMPRLRQAAAEAVVRLSLEPFAVESEEFQFTAHNSGDFYKPHCDWGPGGAEHRRLTFVYYLHRQPRGFAGGGLRLYDSMEEGNAFSERGYTRVDPADNRLVLFPSYVWHEVESVNCASGLYADGRFTVNGWFGVARV